MKINWTYLLLSLFLLLTCSTFGQKDSTHFVTTWKTNNPGTTGDSTIQINTDGSLTYLFDVDWDDDGVFDDLNVTGNIAHTYSDTGIYTIRIRGLFPRILFGVYSQNANKLITINQWGSNVWTTMYRAFENCNNVDCIAIDSPDLSVTTDLRGMFSSAYNFNGSISNWDVSNITTVRSMFGRCYLFNGDITSWNVSNISNFDRMFYSCRAFNQPIGNWDVSNATNLSGMFRGEHIVPNIFNQDISSWDVDSVTDFSDMFMYCDSFNINIGSWDVSSGTDMTYMFRSAKSFNQDITSWDVDSVLVMQGMFQRASSFNQDVSSWDVRSVQNTWWMFEEAISFNQNISNWQMGANTNMYGMFEDATSFNQNLANWDIGLVTTMRHMFARSDMSISNYDSTLISWQQKPHLNNVEFYPYQMEYCLADSARSLLIADGWVFNGDSKNCLTTTLADTQIEENELLVFPNPTRNNFTIRSSEGQLNSGNQLIEILDLSGKLLKIEQLVQAEQNVSISNLPNGIYLVRVGKWIDRLIVQ